MKPLLKLDGAALEKQYSDSIEELALKPGMLGVIFKGARMKQQTIGWNGGVERRHS